MPPTQALVLAAHGSHHDPRTAVPAHRHAERVRERGCFDAVRAAFWKEQPSLAAVLATVQTETTYVVPLMTSEGYFTDRVFPRELGIDGERTGRTARTVRYTAPVGTHRRIVGVVLDRARSALDGAVAESDVGLAVVGHGTERHRESATATATHAARLRSLDRFAAVEPLFLDQDPNVSDLAAAFESDVSDIVVVPLFVADGGHVRSDIPDALGLRADRDPFGGPMRIDGKRVWYARAVGTAPGLTEVILERAAEAGAEIGRRPRGNRTNVSDAAKTFLRWLEAGAEFPTGEAGEATRVRTWGELVITVTDDDGRQRYALRHRDDWRVPATALDRVPSPAAVRERTGMDEADNHRPLRTARSLPRGWTATDLDREDLVRAVRAVYPASIDHWYRDRTGGLDVASFASVVERQAGRYRELDEIDDETLTATVDACCGDCVRQRQWSADGVASDSGEGDFACPEPCSFLLEAARSFDEMDDPPSTGDDAIDPAVPAAAFDRAGNRTHVRFRRAVKATEDDQTQPPLPP